MAFAIMLRRSASAAAPLALRFVGIIRRHHSSALFAAKHCGGDRQNMCRILFPSVVHFSSETAKATSSDRGLIRFLESEIECADEEDHDEAEDVPAEFPFKIVDNTGEAVVKLTRQYEGETVEVEVYMPDLSANGDEYDDGKDDDGKTDNDMENSQQSVLPLLVKISKNVGPSLEFSCSATADEIHIDALSVKNPEASEDMAYDGPDFGDLDENLQKAFHKYLSVRGITPSATNFMHEYMVNKDGREYKMWLKNLKKFVEA